MDRWHVCDWSRCVSSSEGAARGPHAVHSHGARSGQLAVAFAPCTLCCVYRGVARACARRWRGGGVANVCAVARSCARACLCCAWISPVAAPQLLPLRAPHTQNPGSRAAAASQACQPLPCGTSSGCVSAWAYGARPGAARRAVGLGRCLCASTEVQTHASACTPRGRGGGPCSGGLRGCPVVGLVHALWFGLAHALWFDLVVAMASPRHPCVAATASLRVVTGAYTSSGGPSQVPLPRPILTCRSSRAKACKALELLVLAQLLQRPLLP
jgi:hypothetical protein